MNTRPVIRVAALGAILLPAALLATGCSVVDQVVYHREALSFPDRAALREAGNHLESWVPADAGDITGTASTTASDAVVMLHSAQELDPAECTEVPRRSAPVYSVPDAPDVYKIDTVFACGSWSVVRTDDGWLGWTPNSPDEAAASPGS